MQFSRKFAVTMMLPPLVVALPVALAFLVRVTRVPAATAWRVTLVAAGLYAAAAFVAAMLFASRARRVEEAVAGRGDPSEAVSRTLSDTTLISAVLWLGWGFVVSMSGAALLDPTFLGIQYFGEAALITGAPAMAWSYWAGKRMLVDAADGARAVSYIGRTWSVGVKIAIVFIGFFVVSAGALVLVVASYVASTLGQKVAYDIGRFGLLVAGLTTLVFAVATWFLAHDVTRPMQELMRLADEMAEGRFGVETHIFADDEVGVLARSFGMTRQRLRALIGNVGTHGGSITTGVRTMTHGTASLVEGAHEQSGMAEKTASALTQVQEEAHSVLREADGVAELTAESAASATELTASVAEVAQRVTELFLSVEKSSSAANEIDAAARETASRTMSLSGIGSDVLAFVSQMDATVGQIMRTAQSTADLSVQVRDHAEEGRRAVEATVEGIRNAQASTQRTAGAFESLQKSLGQIDQILLFIDDVTNRTNLLSLNAAIIAAHAGTQDHGFSVIADEVRQLADRTRDATKEIASIIRGVRPVTREAVEALDEGVRNVDRTVRLAQNATAALATILESADRSRDMARVISKSLEEQAQASRHLHTVTAKMSDNLAEMHRASEGQAVATRMLATEAERVSEIAEQVRRATDEQTISAAGIARAMEQIANDIRSIRDRLDRQMRQSEQIASASRVTLQIAERNNTIAEQFRSSLDALVRTGQDFESEVARFTTA